MRWRSSNGINYMWKKCSQEIVQRFGDTCKIWVKMFLHKYYKLDRSNKKQFLIDNKGFTNKNYIKSQD